MSLSTHVLDLARGTPAAGVPVRLERRDERGSWSLVTETRTDPDGRVRALLPEGTTLERATYRLTFDVATYQGPSAFFPEATIVFSVSAPETHHHVPLLLSPFGYSTYRGS